MPKNNKSRNNRNKKYNNRARGHKNNQTRELNYQEPRRAIYTTQNNVIDYLSEDDEISSQRYGCVSFATITDEMKEEICEQIAGQLEKPLTEIKEVIEQWCSRENPKRALKIRGVFKTMEQTYRRAEEIRHFDSNFHVFTCEIGKWLPFDPNPDLIEDENYMEDQLNQLLKGYKQNRTNTKQHYDERKREMMEKAIQEGTPDGQKQLMETEEPYEAVKFKAEQATDTIEQLETRIKDLKQTQEQALTKLSKMTPTDTSDENNNKIVADITVETVEVETVEVEVNEERQEIKKGLAEMRHIQESSKKLQTSDFASQLQSRGVTPGSDRNSLTHSMFGGNNLVPEQLRTEHLKEDEQFREKREQLDDFIQKKK